MVTLHTEALQFLESTRTTLAHSESAQKQHQYKGLKKKTIGETTKSVGEGKHDDGDREESERSTSATPGRRALSPR